MSTRRCKCDDCQRSYGPRGGPHEGHDAVCETCEGHPGHVPCPDCQMTSVEDEDPSDSTPPATESASGEKHAIACPKGHTKDLLLRVVVDCPVILGGAGIEPALSEDCEIQPPSGSIGCDDGIWCPHCEEWYDDSECVWPADDAGNPIIDDLGNAEVES